MTHRGASYPPPTPSSSPSSILALEASGANPELLRSMMDCVDTSLFSPAQLANWSHMKTRLAAASSAGESGESDGDEERVLVKTEVPLDRNNGATSVHYNNGASNTSSGRNTIGGGTMDEDESASDYRPLLHREASIQDVLACLLDQQPPSARRLHSSGPSFLETTSTSSKPHNNNNCNTSSTTTTNTSGNSSDPKPPSLQKLLSASAFSMTEKKESMRQLLSFIDSSFASNTPEPLTQVYKDCEAGTLQRLSSLQLMRSFMTPTPPSSSSSSNNNCSASGAQGNTRSSSSSGMGTRTTSFEIIQAMLNATSNQAIQKPMTSQDSFRFQHLARTLESIETDVSVIDNEDYGGDDVVQVDNLDNLLDYQGAHGSHGASTTSSAATAFAGGTQPQVNPSRTIYSEMNSTALGSGSTFPTFGHSLNHQQHAGFSGAASTASSGGLPTIDMMNQQQQNLPFHHQQQQQQHHHQLHVQQQLLRQEQEQKQQHQYNRLYHNTLLQQQQPRSGVMLSAPGYGGTNQPMPQFPNMIMQPGADMLSHKQQLMRSGGHPPQPMRISTQGGRPIRTDANGIPLCSALGCNHAARVKGMCKLHGGGRRCKVDGCMKSAQTGHLCIAHGGGKPCSVDGCPKTAQSRGLCKQHGGGVRCKFEGCTKSCQSGGFCRGHGGGKRCEYPSCAKWAQKNGHCAKHAQEIAAQHVQQQQALQTQMQQQQLVHP